MIFANKSEKPDGVITLTAYNDQVQKNATRTITNAHPSFDAIVAGIDNGDDSVWDLFDVASGLNARFRKITDRVSFDGENILWDGDVAHSVIAKQLERALNHGVQDYEALAKFWELLENNPNEHSREQAYSWLASHDFKITSEGYIIAYKGVYRTETGGYESTHSSSVADVPSGFVNGVAVPPLSRIPQNIGDEVSMPRSEVVHDPAQACRRGLHVGTFSYASSYGNVILEVHVNPRDFVSVPTDGGGEKARTCKYLVKSEVTREVGGNSPVVGDKEVTWTGVGYAGV